MLCPKCNKVLFRVYNTYKCPNNHSYDIAKEGYVNLLLSRTASGDDKDLVNGRIEFLNTGFYEPLQSRLEKIITDLSPNNDIKLLDMGCGTGYYTSAFGKIATTFGLDISKEAIKYAAKHDKNSTYLVASNKNAPFESHTFDFLVHIFSPIFENEDIRLLKNGGFLILVEAGPKHLIELKNLLYENTYFNEEKSHIFPTLKIVEKFSLKYSKEIDQTALKNLVKMTPYFYTTKKENFSALNVDKKILLTIDFSVSIFKAVF